MGWGLLHIFTNAIEHILIGFFLGHVAPIVALTLFYTVATFSTLLIVRWILRENFCWEEILRHRIASAGYLFGLTFGNFLWFLSVVHLGVGGTAIVQVLLRVILVVYGVVFLSEQMSRIQ